jgi:hypothetical protein
MLPGLAPVTAKPHILDYRTFVAPIGTKNQLFVMTTPEGETAIEARSPTSTTRAMTTDITAAVVPPNHATKKGGGRQPAPRTITHTMNYDRESCPEKLKAPSSLIVLRCFQR